MPAAAVAPANRGHNVFSNAFRGRSRAASEVGPQSPRGKEQPQMSKAASYTYFPRVDDLDQSSAVGVKATIAEGELQQQAHGERTSDSSGGSSPCSEEEPEIEQMPELRPKLESISSRRSSRFLSFSSRSREPSAERKSERKADRGRKDAVKHEDEPSVSPARSMSKLRRKSWIVSSDSLPRKSTTSPSREKSKKDENKKKIQEANKRKTASTASIPETSEANTTTTSSVQPRAPISKKNKRLSGLFNATVNVPPVPAVPKSFSTEKLPLSTQPRTPLSPTGVPPLPRNVSHENFKGVKTEPRKKDELWTVFRTLDADLRKFQSKSLALKANVLRTTLLPFLRTYASHPSNHKLRPEDLDRRTNILNAWWTGLLELVAGRNNQSISGTDRPAILEAIAGVMERPEWRLSPSPFCALADRSETSSTSTLGSAASSSSDFLAESVYHNVRNTFTQNLSAQMRFVVEKMSQRSAAASLVTFCGKTCAYAFCFCPGIADILVRLWAPSTEMMRRVLEESGVSKMDRLDAVSDRIVASFPPMLHSLKYSTLGKLARTLRQPASPPFGTADLDWYGLWMKRWAGSESDLFYVFVKHYHILVTEFLPVEPSDAERICVPGLIPVHAQILVNLDATINRHTAPPQLEDPGAAAVAPITFDDVLETDANASALAIPAANATRQMQENRLVMLIRDFLSERNAHLQPARRIFAESFSRLLRAQARKIAIYDNNACYTLCDFLEEAFAILVRYEQSDREHHSVMDWTFWLSVCKMMTQSHNTATEIKLYAFLYSIWPTIAVDERRKASLCLDFILEPEFFESRFNHWCPMVRSYFMRLICWRVARFDGDDTDIEIAIKRSLSDRLRSIWSHYLWLQEAAEHDNTVIPSTTACKPAPGRRFLIIRNDNPIVANNGPFLSFDGVVQNPHQRKPSPSNPVPPEPEAIRPTSALSTDSHDFPDEDATKGKWNILKSVFGGSSKQAAKSKAITTKEKEKEKENTNKAPAVKPTPEAAEKPPVVERPAPVPQPSSTTHRSYSFRFSLEWVDKRFGAYQNMRLQPPRLPLPAQILLQQKGINIDAVSSAQPTGAAATSSRYAGRALAEWTFVSHECQNFFDRRKNEGVPVNRQVETPTLNVEAFRRPG
ncbi:hypothetical protein HBI18_223820 [Parastagonospora nodorum]|nr:hypothetical protein HBI78_225840 [Parastagonospora nodorum]KAH5211435.1 hypothetical protein HBH77_071760 [Parastagonospora nodorum]KAH5710493.1 hypothetical protein HBI18_223820 [Parastagonospora nodorum]KAH5777355.1 hypothetical protein HBI16_075830 [Parastagonospora nodorum]KAH6104444.1 hypothetical protein HBI65_041970 [Parastagonospora nodorum]